MPPTSTRSTKTNSRRGERGASDRTAHKPLAPFTVDHFRAYGRRLVLDNGDRWEVEPFQLEVVDDLLGGARAVWAVLPEANGKTTLMSGVALYWGDYTPEGFVCMAASSRDQAGWLLRQAIGFVKRSPGMAARFRPYEGYRRIDAKRSGARIQVFAADKETADGVIFDLALIDELHRHKSLDLYRTWLGKTIKVGGQVGVISTAGAAGSEFEANRHKLRTEGEATRCGSHTRSSLGGVVLHDWSVPTESDVHDLEIVKAANPLSTVTIESLREKHDDPTTNEGHWRRFTCGQAVRSEFAAIDEREWHGAEGAWPVEPGQAIWVGLDPAWKVDTFAVVPYFEADREHRYLGAAKTFVPTPERPVRPAEVKRYLAALHERTPIEVAVLDTNFAADIAEYLEDELGARVVAHAQTDKPMGLAFERFMKLLRNGHLFHSGDRTLTRHALNAIAHQTRTGWQKFERPVASRTAPGRQAERVIDALDAAAMVVSVADAEGTSKRGKLTAEDFVVL
jgi:phage terminase large subunit-like protein